MNWSEEHGEKMDREPYDANPSFVRMRKGSSPELDRRVRWRIWPRSSFSVGGRLLRRRRWRRAARKELPVRRFGFERRKAKRAMEQEASTGRKPPIYSLRGHACGSSARTFSAADFAQKDNCAWQPRARLPLPSAGAVDRFAQRAALRQKYPRLNTASK